MSSKAAATESLIREFHTLFATQKFREFIQFAAPGATWWISGLKESNPMAGLHTFEEHVKHVQSVPKSVFNWDAYESTITELVVDEKGEKAVVEVAVQLNEDDGEIRYKNSAVLIIKVKGGKVEQIREYLDYAPIAKYTKEKEEKGKV